MERVAGIGGVFFRARDPKALGEWYARHLGLTLEEWGGALFHDGDATTVWSPFPQDTDYFGASGQQAMVNYRVRDLDAMVAQLRAAGIEVEGPADEQGLGRFAWAVDLEGNRLELWEPAPR